MNLSEVMLIYAGGVIAGINLQLNSFFLLVLEVATLSLVVYMAASKIAIQRRRLL